MTHNEEVIRNLIVGSPWGGQLGAGLESVGAEQAVVRLPFRPEVVTVGDVVHGGAISSLIDVAATAAVWTMADMSASPRGTTIGFTVNFLNAARGEDVIAEARVIQRGRSICVAEVEVRTVGGKSVARALVTYKLG